jgi:hypothetical protein
MMRNEKVADFWIKDFEERNGRKATPEEEAMFRELADRVPELKPRSDAPGYGDASGLSSPPQKSRHTEQELKKGSTGMNFHTPPMKAKIRENRPDSITGLLLILFWCKNESVRGTPPWVPGRAGGVA